MPWPALLALLGGAGAGAAAGAGAGAAGAGGAAAAGGGLAGLTGQIGGIMGGLDSANILQQGLSGSGGLGATSGKPFNMGTVMEQLGGMMPPDQKGEEPGWLEKIGIIQGEGDKYKKEMGIQDAPMVLPKLDAGGGMQELMSMMKMAQQPQQQRRPRQDFRDLIMSGHLKTLMGG